MTEKLWNYADIHASIRNAHKRNDMEHAKWRIRKLPAGYWQVREPHQAGGYLHYAFATGADALATFAGGWPR
jgi:hypothetical protein